MTLTEAVLVYPPGTRVKITRTYLPGGSVTGTILNRYEEELGHTYMDVVCDHDNERHSFEAYAVEIITDKVPND
jgi:hypothetical protein